jgi:PAT family beta-lactamase induction signal transducer AmpG
MTSWRSTLNIYADIRMLWVFCLGVCSGFPWALIGSNLSGWLKDEGISRGEIGLLGSITAIFALNFLWAPLVDRHGSRRRHYTSWILPLQLLSLTSVIGLALLQPFDALAGDDATHGEHLSGTGAVVGDDHAADFVHA